MLGWRMSDIGTQVNQAMMRIRYLEGAVQEIHKVVDKLAASVTATQAAVRATQAKVGIDNSEDPKSLDYRVGSLEAK